MTCWIEWELCRIPAQWQAHEANGEMDFWLNNVQFSAAGFNDFVYDTWMPAHPLHVQSRFPSLTLFFVPTF